MNRPPGMNFFEKASTIDAETPGEWEKTCGSYSPAAMSRATSWATRFVPLPLDCIFASMANAPTLSPLTSRTGLLTQPPGARIGDESDLLASAQVSVEVEHSDEVTEL